jgi:hypothetical protein
MPPLKPSGVTARFQKQVTNLLRDYEELLLAIHEKRRHASLATMISEQSVMLIAVLWEAFINDLFVSYVSGDPEQCFRNFKERFYQSNNEKFAGVVRWVSLENPQEPSHAFMRLAWPKSRGFLGAIVRKLPLAPLAGRVWPRHP